MGKAGIALGLLNKNSFALSWPVWDLSQKPAETS
jgi:hypothetical protein